jgi:quercetin dioxygenase-like cupin family protein
VQKHRTPRFFQGETGANSDNYTGTIWLNELNHPDSNFTFSLAQAVYAPGAKLHWHVHPEANTCYYRRHRYYQEKGKPGQIVHKGDIVKCLRGVEHWHGAAPGSGIAYVAVTPVTKRKNNMAAESNG